MELDAPQDVQPEYHSSAHGTFLSEQYYRDWAVYCAKTGTPMWPIRSDPVKYFVYPKAGSSSE